MVQERSAGVFLVGESAPLGDGTFQVDFGLTTILANLRAALGRVVVVVFVEGVVVIATEAALCVLEFPTGEFDEPFSHVVMLLIYSQ